MLNNSVFDTTSIVNSLPSIDRSSIFDEPSQLTVQYLNNKHKDNKFWCERHHKFHNHDHDEDNIVPLSDGFPFLFILILIYTLYKNATLRRSKRTI